MHDFRGFDRLTGHAFASRSEVIAPHAMAATSHPLATQVALQAMRSGGSAVDGAIAANAALGLMEPTGGGIGGDLFAIVWDPDTRRVQGINASGRAPRGATLETLRAGGRTAMPETGALTVTVPGCVDGWFSLHEQFGLLEMPELLAPVIAYARDGVPMPELIATHWARAAQRFADAPHYAATFLVDGAPPRKGQRFANPRLAETYERIAHGGPEAFYRGEIAAAIAAEVQAQGGHLAAEDLAAHASDWVEPLHTRYRGHEVWQLPPNTQGLAVLQMLNVLEGFDLAGAGFGSADHVHLLVEAKKLAWADRAHWYADPDAAALPVDALLSPAYTKACRARIDPARASQHATPYDPRLAAGDTVYLTVADPDGMMVSLIQSNCRGMGSGVVPAGLGFMLQNRGQMFSLDPAHANAWAPGKRPFHTIIPAFVTRGGEPWLSFGVMGAEMQPQGQVQVLVNLIDFGMNLQEAGDAPRVRHDGPPEPFGAPAGDADGGTVMLESGFGDAVRGALRARGHRVEAAPRGVESFGGYQAILRDHANGAWVGASEARKDGQAAGW